MEVIMQKPWEFFDIWLFSQTFLSEEVRWKHHLRLNDLRRQTVGQHTIGLIYLMEFVLRRLNSYFLIDRDLLLRACVVHGWADGELRRVDDLVKREPEHDLQDVAAFQMRFSHLDKQLSDHFLQAFLLQFVDCESMKRRLFDCDVQSSLDNLKDQKSLEVCVFKFVEILDYLYYAVEQLRDHKEPGVLREVLSNTLYEMDSLAQSIPGAKEVLWTSLREKCLVMAETGVFIE